MADLNFINKQASLIIELERGFDKACKIVNKCLYGDSITKSDSILLSALLMHRLHERVKENPEAPSWFISIIEECSK